MQSSRDHVRQLNSTTLKPFIESMGVVLLSVVMLPISRRCRLFVPEYQKVGSPIRSAVLICSVLNVLDQIADNMQDSGITFAQIDALDNSNVLAPFSISTFPHVMLFQGFDSFRAYRGAFKETEYVFWWHICGCVK